MISPSTDVAAAAVDGPFGKADHVISLSSASVAEMYRRKCGVDISGDLHSPNIHLYECAKTKFRFWLPRDVAGNESFYERLSAAWSAYYRPWRWEYANAAKMIRPTDRVLEIGCGRGYFLRHLEAKLGANSAVGLELNNEAIAGKVTAFPVYLQTIEAFSRGAFQPFDAVCAFQVLEHVADVDSFMRACISCLAPGGSLIFSTPNPDYVVHSNMEDAFDLPPHHVNHLSLDAYRGIGRHYGLRLETFVNERRSASVASVTARTGGNPVYRVLAGSARRLLNAGYRMTDEPGASTLVRLRMDR